MTDFVVITKDLSNITGLKIEENDVAIVESADKEASNLYLVREGVHTEVKNSDFRHFDISETGDAYPQKICNVCHKLLATDQFDINQHGINNREVRRPSCRECRKVIDGVPISSADKKEWNKKKPHLVPFECPICHKTTIPGLTSKVVLDHCHDTGKVRTWICDSCNTGIGRFKDNVEILKRAIEYLQKEY